MKLRISSLFCRIIALICEIMPFSAVLHFALLDRVDDAYFSYFDFISWGYGNIFPPLTAILTVVLIVLESILVLLMCKGRYSAGVENAVFIIGILAAALSFGQLIFGLRYMTALSWVISAMLVISAYVCFRIKKIKK